jgi:hypothetical protein
MNYHAQIFKWSEVQVGVNETFDSQDTQATYLHLRRSIRERLVR